LVGLNEVNSVIYMKIGTKLCRNLLPSSARLRGAGPIRDRIYMRMPYLHHPLWLEMPWEFV